MITKNGINTILEQLAAKIDRVATNRARDRFGLGPWILLDDEDKAKYIKSERDRLLHEIIR